MADEVEVRNPDSSPEDASAESNIDFDHYFPELVDACLSFETKVQEFKKDTATY